MTRSGGNTASKKLEGVDPAAAALTAMLSQFTTARMQDVTDDVATVRGITVSSTPEGVKIGNTTAKAEGMHDDTVAACAEQNSSQAAVPNSNTSAKGTDNSRRTITSKSERNEYRRIRSAWDKELDQTLARERRYSEWGHVIADSGDFHQLKLHLATKKVQLLQARNKVDQMALNLLDSSATVSELEELRCAWEDRLHECKSMLDVKSAASVMALDTEVITTRDGKTGCSIMQRVITDDAEQVEDREDIRRRIQRTVQESETAMDELTQLYLARANAVYSSAKDEIEACAPNASPELLATPHSEVNPTCTSATNDVAHSPHVPQNIQELKERDYLGGQPITHQASPLERIYMNAQVHVVDEDDKVTIHSMSQQRKVLTAAGPRYQSMKATLMIGAGLHDKVATVVIVDSGAAFTAVRADWLRSNFPAAFETIVKANNMKFTDAQGRTMPLLGEVQLYVCVAGHCYWTRAFVFEQLGVEFLLGVNALVDGGVVIDARNRSMMVGGQAGSEDIEVTHNPEATSCAMHVSLDQQRGLVYIGKPASQQMCKLDLQVTLDTCPIAEMDEHDGWIPLYCSHTIHMPPAGKHKATRCDILCDYNEWIAGAAQTVECIPSDELNERGVTSCEKVLHSSMNAHAFLPAANPTDTVITLEKGAHVGYARVRPEGVDSKPPVQQILLAFEMTSITERAKKPYAEGGPPATEDDFRDLGVDLSECIHPGMRRADGSYAPLPEAIKDRIRELVRVWWTVWARDARAPLVSRLVVIDCPTVGGDDNPVAQKPYPIPAKYIPAVREEIQKLLDAGIIEPGISNWASPTLLTIKKDSKPGEPVKIKIVTDLRKLNERVIPDLGGLGTQEEILLGFAGQPYAGLADLAGGFYQCAVNPLHKHRLSFVLPTALGGTQFQWRVAPYGMARCPASYSRGIMFALQGLQDTNLAPFGSSKGGTHSWIDDITVHSDTMEGFLDQLERVFMRLAFCGLSLKASKMHLLRANLEVLGFLITPEGIKSNPAKVEVIKRIPIPSNADEARTYLGSVNFYRRFVPRIAMLAKPLTDMLKKDSVYDPEAVRQAVTAINELLISDEVMSLPNFDDPLAHFVLCTDASEISVGGVLMQWQHTLQRGPGPPSGVPLGGEKGKDPLNQSWRLDCGWTLRTIGYFSKTLDSAQSRYNVFDKEAGAILYGLRHYADIITGFPVTVYTDSIVAASMLSKHDGTKRLQRWGIELQGYIPHLRIQYRQGALNGAADLLSRFPYFKRYMLQREHIVTLPDDLYDKVSEAHLGKERAPDVHALTTVRPNGRVRLQLKLRPVDKYDLYEAKDCSPEPGAIWQQQTETTLNVNHAQSVTPEYSRSQRKGMKLPEQVEITKQAFENTPFFECQRDYEEQQATWDLYVQAFIATMGRAPVVYDLFCGEGGFSRGARLSGAECYGFDHNSDFRTNYETDPAIRDGVAVRIDSGMRFVHADLDDPIFWEQLVTNGCHVGIPPPDIIHASPPCDQFTRLRHVRKRSEPLVADVKALNRIDALIVRLRRVESNATRPLAWQIENVPESLGYVQQEHTKHVMLCGAMMGHRVFRHRVFYCSYAAEVELKHSHKGYVVGSRGVRRAHTQSGSIVEHEEPNMYGVYSRMDKTRGSYDQWHGALGAMPGTYSRRAITGVLPSGYGRYLTSQMVAHVLHRSHGVPIYSPTAIDAHQRLILDEIAHRGACCPPMISCVTCTECDCEHDCDHCANQLCSVAATPEQERQPVEHDASAQANHDGELQYDLDRAAATSPPFCIKPTHQQQDPHLSRLIRELADQQTDVAKSGLWQMSKGTLRRVEYNVLGEQKLLVVIPCALRHEVMHFAHNTLNPGHKKGILASSLRSWCYWDSMQADCEKFQCHCRLCQETSRNFRTAQVPPGEAYEAPSRPFEHVYIDYKGELPDSGGFKYILVVVCSLTRYTLYIPCKDRSAESTFRALFANVFCLFGIPKRITSDNGREFNNAFIRHLGQFLGFRMIHVLPHNPQANGKAEAAVKRVKVLLERHTLRYKNWHRMLPIIQYMLNVEEHSGTQMSPFLAVFGREPTKLPHLENPDLDTQDPEPTFVSSLRSRLSELHKRLKQTADNISTTRRLAAEAKQDRRRDLHVVVGDHIWLLHGSHDSAKFQRRHGHGSPWRHMYEVLDVTMYGVKVKPLHDAPRVSEWQPKHKVFLAPPRFNDDDFTYDIDAHTGLAIAPGTSQPEPKVQTDIPLAPLQTEGPPADKDGEYEVESVLSAVKRSGRWYLTIKWVGYSETTEETRTWLKQAASPAVVAMAEEAIARAMLRKRNVTFTESPDDVDDEDPDQSMHSMYVIHQDGNDGAAMTGRVMRAAQSILLKQIGGVDHVLLLLRKATSSKPACWFFPGGKCEPDESFISACQRELYEETGVMLAVDAFQECWSSTGTKLGKFWTLRDFVARIGADTTDCFVNKEPDKHDKLMWMPVSHALKMTDDEQLDRVPGRVQAAVDTNAMCTRGVIECHCARCLMDATMLPTSAVAMRRMKSMLHVHLRYW